MVDQLEPAGGHRAIEQALAPAQHDGEGHQHEPVEQAKAFVRTFAKPAAQHCPALLQEFACVLERIAIGLHAAVAGGQLDQRVAFLIADGGIDHSDARTARRFGQGITGTLC